MLRTLSLLVEKQRIASISFCAQVLLISERKCRQKTVNLVCNSSTTLGLIIEFNYNRYVSLFNYNGYTMDVHCWRTIG